MQPGCGLRFRHLANQQADMIVRAVWPLWCTPWTVPLAGVGAGESRGPCTGSLGARDAQVGISCSQDAAFVSVTWPISRLILLFALCGPFGAPPGRYLWRGWALANLGGRARGHWGPLARRDYGTAKRHPQLYASQRTDPPTKQKQVPLAVVKMF